MDLHTAISNSYPEETYNLKLLKVCDLTSEKDEDLKKQIKKENKFKNFQEYQNELHFTKIEITINDKKSDSSILYNNKYLNIKTENSSIFVYGRYIKMSREISQTPMIIKGCNKFSQTKKGTKILKYEKSVSDFTESFKTYFMADECKFISAGREDADVRMIGGRPFILEIMNPKRHINVSGISEIDISTYPEIKLIDLCFVKGNEVRNFILNGETKNKKIYEGIFYVKNKSINLKKIENEYFIKQCTPLRVLHRRSNMERSKQVNIISIEQFDEDADGLFIRIKIKASAGCYIKEFVNGDFGRTVPSISSELECYCDLVELDVLEVDCDDLNDKWIIGKFKINN